MLNLTSAASNSTAKPCSFSSTASTSAEPPSNPGTSERNNIRKFIMLDFVRHAICYGTPRSKLGNALAYAANQWPHLEALLPANWIKTRPAACQTIEKPDCIDAIVPRPLAKMREVLCRPLTEDYLVEVIKRLPPDTTPEQAAVLTPARIAAERRTAAESAA